MADEPHKHKWQDAWGADCVVCHIDLIDYAESAQERITALEAQYTTAMAIVRAVDELHTQLDNENEWWMAIEDLPVLDMMHKARALLAQE